MDAIRPTQLEALDVLVGTWRTTVTHPMIDGEHPGTASFEWLAGERFLVVHQTCEHPLIPDSISVIGEPSPELPPTDAPLVMQYFDSRGVHRLYETSIDGAIWRNWRDHPGFDQRFEGRISDDGTTIEGLSRLRRDDEFEDDLAIVYRRAGSRPAT